MAAAITLTIGAAIIPGSGHYPNNKPFFGNRFFWNPAFLESGFSGIRFLESGILESGSSGIRLSGIRIFWNPAFWNPAFLESGFFQPSYEMHLDAAIVLAISRVLIRFPRVLKGILGFFYREIDFPIKN